MTVEQYYAELEGARCEAEDEYFKARPQLMRTIAEQCLFRAGFDLAFKKLWRTEPPKSAHSVWVVFNSDGFPEICFPDEQMCHDHINEAIDEDLDDAGAMVVREYVPALAAAPQAQAIELWTDEREMLIRFHENGRDACVQSDQFNGAAHHSTRLMQLRAPQTKATAHD